MNKKSVAILTVAFLAAALPLMAQASAVKDSFDRAKLLMFDKKWRQALTELDQIVKDHPDSQYYTMALFYTAKCQEELHQWEKALKNYSQYILRSRSESLKEEAQVAIIEAAFQLFQAGKREHVQKIEELLKSPNQMARYYAAIKLSYLEDKKLARKAVSILKSLIANETDEQLIDRAKIALLRIDPDYLKEVSKRGLELAFLKIQSYNKKTRKVNISISIPFALARLALDALPKKEKESLRKEGYDLDRILEKLVKSGDILKVESNDEIFRLWVE